MTARLVAGLLASAVVAKATVELDDRTVLMQTAVQMPAEQDMEAEMMVRDFEKFLASSGEKAHRLESEAGMGINMVEMVRADGLKPPQAVATEEVEQEEADTTFPPELQQLMDEVYKNPPRMPAAGRVLSLLRNKVPSMQNVSLEMLEGVTAMTDEVANALQRGSAMADKIKEQLPLMFRLLSSKSLFKGAEPAASALRSKDGWRQIFSNFQELVGAPAQHALNKFEGSSGLGGGKTAQLFASAGTQRSEKPVCGSGPYVRVRVAPGIRFFPVQQTGYFLQANVGYEVAMKGPMPCFNQPIIELQLEKKEATGHVMGLNLQAAFKPWGNEPLKYFLYRDMNLFLKEGQAVTPVSGDGWKKTAIHQIVAAAGTKLSSAPWAEAAMKFEWIPKDTYEKSAGTESLVMLAAGMHQEGFDYADVHVTGTSKAADVLALRFGAMESVKLGYTLDEPGVSL